jgi:hypothetical protein
VILGRNTVGWMAVVTAGINLVGLVFPGIQPAVLQGLSVLAAAIIALLANTSTTPTADPQLKQGTMVRVTDDTGTVIGHTPVPGPGAAGADQ